MFPYQRVALRYLRATRGNVLVLDIGKRITIKMKGTGSHEVIEKVYDFIRMAVSSDLYLGVSAMKTDLRAQESLFALVSTAGPALGEVNGARTREVLRDLVKRGLAREWFTQVMTGDGDDITSRF
jgi:hypothetical protein